MSDESCCSSVGVRASAALLGVLGTLLVLGALAVYLVRVNQPAPVGSARAEERKKTWTELQAANVETLGGYGVVKADNGIYRIPVAKAMEVTVTEWKDGNVAGRAKLIQRLEESLKKATFE
ncbi:MAG: hypothetical protein WCP53_00020 [Verrucomicrobiota bacterium]